MLWEYNFWMSRIFPKECLVKLAKEPFQVVLALIIFLLIYMHPNQNNNMAKKLQWLAQLVEQSTPKHVAKNKTISDRYKSSWIPPGYQLLLWLPVESHPRSGGIPWSFPKNNNIARMYSSHNSHTNFPQHSGENKKSKSNKVIPKAQ